MEPENFTKTLTIWQVASMLGVTRPTLRHYENLGLIRPQRAPNGTRLYGKTDLVRMKLILRLKMGGFTLQKIHDFVVLDKEGEDLATLSSGAGETFEHFIEEITRQIVCLEGLKEELFAFRRKTQAIRTAE